MSAILKSGTAIATGRSQTKPAPITPHNPERLSEIEALPILISVEEALLEFAHLGFWRVA
jgi:hypothetical protein